jgi:hypothetical protein
VKARSQIIFVPTIILCARICDEKVFGFLVVHTRRFFKVRPYHVQGLAEVEVHSDDLCNRVVLLPFATMKDVYGLDRNTRHWESGVVGS